jgi:hypothetical protein
VARKTPKIPKIIGRKKYFFQVDFENFLTIDQSGCVNGDVSVEPSGPLEGPIEDIRSIGGSQHHDAFTAAHAVHFHQQLIKGLFLLAAATTHTGGASTSTPFPSDGIDLVDVNDTGSPSPGFFEETSHSGGPQTSDHFDEFRSGHREEWNSGFRGDGFGQEGLPATRGSQQKHPLGDFGSEFPISLLIFQVTDQFHHFLLGFPETGHVSERDALLLGRQRVAQREFRFCHAGKHVSEAGCLDLQLERKTKKIKKLNVPLGKKWEKADFDRLID